MTEDTKNTIFNLPNMITIFRIMLVPVLFLLLFFSPGKLQSFFAGLVFSVASISDCVDGYLARRMNLVTDFGKFLDPLADKLLVGVALIMMIPLGRWPREGLDLIWDGVTWISSIPTYWTLCGPGMAVA